MAGSIEEVDLMLLCDRAASLSSAVVVRSGAHPAFTRVWQLWTGSTRWWPQRQKLKKLISRRLRYLGKQQRDKRASRPGFRVTPTAPSSRNIVTEIAAFLDKDVNHWLETSLDEHPILLIPR
ncbi:unnamed protein product [Peronospora belbahrii]|nr:unnamed protein product [Peronospora belbahrii]